MVESTNENGKSAEIEKGMFLPAKLTSSGNCLTVYN
jgi:hypothetical protein